MITKEDAERVLKGVGRMEDLPGTPHEAFQTIATLYHKVERLETQLAAARKAQLQQSMPIDEIAGLYADQASRSDAHDH